ncbi:MAG: Glycine betaine transport system permease protein [Actinomycetia bacterium]|nr:Glycine betaine transport system permease protein [Actinomycetes bacterium]
MGFLGDVVDWFTAGEHWHGPNGLPHRVGEHVVLSLVAIGIAVVVAVPLGIALGHLRRGGAASGAVANLGRGVPSFALLVLAYKVFGLGVLPTYIALVVLAVPPMLVNAYVGVAEVDNELRDAARGMGMTGWQSLRRVELPLALPLVMGGIRTGAVQVVATATLAAYIAEGGLGRYIVDGQSVQDNVTVFAGALVVALLSVATELGLGAVQRAVTPRGRDAALADAVAAH